MTHIQPYVIGVSGKIGSGKNYLATQLQKEFVRRGYICHETAFAKPLKQELTDIIESLNSDSDYEKATHITADRFDISLEQMTVLADLMKTDITSGVKLTGWDKTEAIRRGLQYLGTDIRRNKKDSYWIDLLAESLPSRKQIVFVPDARFPNEADWLRSINGFLFRLEVPREVILARASERDKIRYSAISESHPSEIALDDYKNFDIIVGETFDASALVDMLEKRISF